LGVYFKYLSENILKMDIFNNYNQLEFCREDCNSYENVLDKKAVKDILKKIFIQALFFCILLFISR
jgi:hypothetical protein